MDLHYFLKTVELLQTPSFCCSGRGGRIASRGGGVAVASPSYRTVVLWKERRYVNNSKAPARKLKLKLITACPKL